MARRSRARTIAAIALLISVILLLTHHHRPLFQQHRSLQTSTKDHLTANGLPENVQSKPHPQVGVDGHIDNLLSDSPVELARTIPAIDGPLYIFALLTLLHSGDSYTTYNFETSLDPPSHSNPTGNRVTSKLSECPQGQQLSTCTSKWVDYLLANFTLSGTSSGPRPTLLAWNFARGASTIDPDIVPPNFWGAKALVDQAKEFLSTVDDTSHAQHVPWTMHGARQSIFVIWFGINDVANTAEQANVDHTTLYMRILGSYIKVLEQLHDAGARRFVLLNMPPLERTPQLLDAGPPHTHALVGAITIFNGLLKALAVGDGSAGDHGLFLSRHPDALVRLVDTQPIFHKKLDAQQAQSRCSGNTASGEPCLWVDAFHPSEEMQMAVGVEVAKMIEDMLTT